MSLEKDFTEIFYTKEIDSLIDFLKQLNKHQKEALVDILIQNKNDLRAKELRNIHTHYEAIDSGRETRKHHETDEFKKIEYLKLKNSVSLFVCNSEDYIGDNTFQVLYEFDILSWCLPKHLYNGKEKIYFLRHYYLQLKCIENNHRKPDKEEIVNALSRFVFTSVNNIPSITLNEHIWYLFKYESLIHNRYDGEGDYWIQTISTLANDNILNRSKVIKEALLSTTRFSNRAITGYFFKMLEVLNPSDSELLHLQNSLFLVLQSQHSKPINQTLKYLKRIHNDPNFKLKAFIDEIPNLLSWDVKSIVNSTLLVIDNLIKTYPKQKEMLAKLIVYTFGQEDESLQIKAIKLLSKYNQLEVKSVVDEISIYYEGLYHSTKQLLPSVDIDTLEEKVVAITPPQRTRDDNCLIYPESFDDLVFFFSQAFEQNNTYDFDLFIALLPKLKLLITKENVNKLEPAFQRAMKCYLSKLNELYTSINIVSLMAIVFLEFAMYLKKQYPDQLLKTERNYKNTIKKYSGKDQHKAWNAVLQLEEAIKFTSYFNAIYAQLLLRLLNSDFSSTPISTPSHLPCWIELTTLIDRIKEQLNNHLEIDLYDMQIALSRVVITSDSEDAIEELPTELKNLFTYMYDDKPLEIKQIKKPELWLIAVIRKDNPEDAKVFIDVFSDKNLKSATLLLNPKWKAYREPWEYEDWENGVKVKKTIMSPKFTLQQNHIVKTFPFNSIFQPSKLGKHYDISSFDINNFLYLTPSSPKFLLQSIILYTFEKYGEHTNKLLQETSLALMEIWDTPGEIEYLYLALILTYEDKTIRNIASELWIKAISEGSIDHQLLGKILGKLEHDEYAPLKRFTDLIVSNMLNLSSMHNTGLALLISSMIMQMNDKPIKGTKKLLEIYFEVLNLTESRLAGEERFLKKLAVWSDVKSLSVILRKLNLIQGSNEKINT